MEERAELERAIASLESQRGVLGDAAVDAALAGLRTRLSSLDAAAAPERRQVTVLFVDVVGYTAMAEHRDAEVVREVMNDLFHRLDAVVLRAGGTVDKHIGDALMAVFGTSGEGEDHPERAVRAALEMQRSVRGISDELGDPEVSLRIGVHTGPAVLGTVGTTGERTVIGDTVNLASRLEGLAPPGAILISHDTYRHVRGVFDVQESGPASVKGKREPVTVYRVDGLKPRAFRRRAWQVEGIETPTVGRERELGDLLVCIREAGRRRQAALVTIVADAGLGKSRLGWALMETLDLMPEPVWLFLGRAEREGADLALIADLLAQRLAIREQGTATGDRRAWIEQSLAELMGEPDPEAARLVAHLLGEDVTGSADLSGDLDDPARIRRNVFDAVARIFKTVSNAGPVVVILDDLHWADPGSLDMVEHVLNACRECPIVMVALSRPDIFLRRPDFADGEGRRRIDLRPLGRQAAAQLLEAMVVRADGVPPGIGDVLLEAASGSPFFLEELVKMLIDERVIETGERWRFHADRFERLRVPTTLTAVLQARLDALDGRERHVLQRAAVVGRVFWQEALTESDDAGEVEAALTTLVGQELVFRRSGSSIDGMRELVFKHALLHEVTYETVLLNQRRAWHREAARWLTVHGGDRWASSIAEHWERAGEAEHAGEWFARAGLAAHDADEFALAIEHLARARRLLEDSASPTRTDVLGALATVRLLRSERDEAQHVLEEMVSVSRAQTDPTGEARAWVRLSQLAFQRDEIAEALEAARQAEALARQAGADGVLAYALAQAGWALILMGRAPEAVESVAPAARAAAEASGEERAVARVHEFMADAYRMVGQFSEAEAAAAKLLDIHERSGDRSGIVAALREMGNNALARGEAFRAVKIFDQALGKADEIGYRYLVGYLGTVLAGALVAADKPGRARALLLDRAEEVAADPAEAGLVYFYLAQAHLRLDEVAEALVAASRCLRLARDFPSFLGLAWRVAGEVASASGGSLEVEGETMDADDCFETAMSLLSEQGNAPELARTLVSRGRHALSAGDSARGRTWLEQGRRLMDELGMPA